jgi:hypothetical protein
VRFAKCRDAKKPAERVAHRRIVAQASCLWGQRRNEE